jgi:hypothetical protein
MMLCETLEKKCFPTKCTTPSLQNTVMKFLNFEILHEGLEGP